MFDYDTATEVLLQQWYQLHRLHSRSSIRALSGGELFILNLLADSDQPVQPRQLSAHMKASTARVAAILNRLEHKGFILRCGDRRDRRRIQVSITPLGLAHVRQQKASVFAAVKKMLESLGEKDSEDFIRLFGRVLDISAGLSEADVSPPSADGDRPLSPTRRQNTNP